MGKSRDWQESAEILDSFCLSLASLSVSLHSVSYFITFKLSVSIFTLLSSPLLCWLGSILNRRSRCWLLSSPVAGCWSVEQPSCRLLSYCLTLLSNGSYRKSGNALTPDVISRSTFFFHFFSLLTGSMGQTPLDFWFAAQSPWLRVRISDALVVLGLMTVNMVRTMLAHAGRS